MNSLEVREFSNSITNYINSSQIPAEVKRLALLNILSEMEKITNMTLKMEIEERNIQKAEEESKKGKGEESVRGNKDNS